MPVAAGPESGPRTTCTQTDFVLWARRQWSKRPKLLLRSRLGFYLQASLCGVRSKALRLRSLWVETDRSAQFGVVDEVAKVVGVNVGARTPHHHANNPLSPSWTTEAGAVRILIVALPEILSGAALFARAISAPCASGIHRQAGIHSCASVPPRQTVSKKTSRN